MIKEEEKVLALITPEDLRFGNLIDAGGLKVPYGTGAVIEILADSVTVKVGEEINIYLYEDLKPIPLSPEWLERAGFEKILGEGLWLPHDNHFSYFRIKANKDNTFSLALKEGNKIIPFVHKLQNLYYELKDEEIIFTML